MFSSPSPPYQSQHTMKVFSFKADGLAVLPSPSYNPRIRSPPVSLRSRSFTTPSNNFSKLRIGSQSPHAEIPAAKSIITAYQRPIARLLLKSRSGKLLLQVMQTRPHLLPSAIDEQLERLCLDRAAAESGDNDDLEEIFYFTIIQKFSEKNISMIGFDSWPDCLEQKLRAVHSAAAMDMIDGHLAFVKERFGPQLGKIRLGKLYSASIKYGYYLKRVDERFQMDRSTNTLPCCSAGSSWDVESTILYDQGNGGVPYGLRSYIRCLDEEMLQQFATVRSKEAMSLIEKHEAGTNGTVGIATASGLTTFVLEAVTFGSFLWAAECYIESKCQLLAC